MIQEYLKTQVGRLSLLVGPVVYLACVPLLQAASESSPSAESRTLTFGVVPQFEQRRLFRVWRPILDELEKKTGLIFQLSGTPKIPAFEKRFMRGEFDVAYMNPYHIVRAYSSQGYIPIVRDGGRKLGGIVVVHKDSVIKDVRDLKGAEVAFPSPNALGASLLVRSELKQKFGVDVTPRYVQTHSSVYLHVAKGLLVAGGGVRRTLNAQHVSVRDSLRIIYNTASVPPHPVAVHPRIGKHYREKIRKGFYEIYKSEQGRKLLAGIPISKLVSADITEYRSMNLDNLEELAESPTPRNRY